MIFNQFSLLAIFVMHFKKGHDEGPGISCLKFSVIFTIFYTHNSVNCAVKATGRRTENTDLVWVS